MKKTTSLSKTISKNTGILYSLFWMFFFHITGLYALIKILLYVIRFGKSTLLISLILLNSQAAQDALIFLDRYTENKLEEKDETQYVTHACEIAACMFWILLIYLCIIVRKQYKINSFGDWRMNTKFFLTIIDISMLYGQLLWRIYCRVIWLTHPYVLSEDTSVEATIVFHSVSFDILTIKYFFYACVTKWLSPI